MLNTQRLYDYNGLIIEKIDTDFPAQIEPSWGAYMGSNYNGIFSMK